MTVRKKPFKLEAVRSLSNVPVVRVSVVREGTAKTMVDNPTCAVTLIRSIIPRDTDREHFVVLMLNARKRVVGANVVSIGTLDGSFAHPREVFKAAILGGAHSIIVAHNHPSGDVVPSIEDRSVTQRLVKAGRTLGIDVVDHIIIGDDSKHYSFSERGEMYVA